MIIHAFRNIFLDGIWLRSKQYVEGEWVEDNNEYGNSFRQQIVDAAKAEEKTTASEAPWLLDVESHYNLAGGPNHVCFIVEKDGRAVGYRDVIWDGERRVDSQYTWVVPSMRRKGIGNMLDNALYEVFGNNIVVYVWARETAHEFWSNRGYQDTGREKKDGVILYEMKKERTVGEQKEAPSSGLFSLSSLKF